MSDPSGAARFRFAHPADSIGHQFTVGGGAPTVQVLDSFTSGGAQQAGGNHATNLDAASDLDYVVGRHSPRTGFVVDAMHYRSDATSNYLGLYTFDSLAAYEASQPRNYTRRIGDPSIA